jgi:hypothetical protein
MIRVIQFAVGILLLISIEVLKVYFIMPFPGSQRSTSIDLAYFIHTNIFYFRTIGILITIFPAFQFLAFGKTLPRIITGVALLLYFLVFYLFNFRFTADRMFYQPKNKLFAAANDNKVPLSKLVVGVTFGNDSKAYPIEVIGYHHQVRDTIGNTPVMITYCTVCRTGRVYSPDVDGKTETFRLVGMDHFNAMFEDQTTGSWWRQVSGESIVGPMKGKSLTELPSAQMTLRAWLDQHPSSKVMQPDPGFKEKYEHLKGFDSGTIESGLEKRDSISWREKSWVVGVQLGLSARAYDWNDLQRLKVINDTVQGTAIALVLESDSTSFHVWNRDSLIFASDNIGLYDKQTNSRWDWTGRSTDGTLKDQRLKELQSYQEFWHSWKTFHPQTTQYHP